ncbi:MAG: hypothetical protein K2G90_02720 [Muribaculaceae bacterium]|nr:hypothetical protein [Muribaculaceae bacterium]
MRCDIDAVRVFSIIGRYGVCRVVALLRFSNLLWPGISMQTLTDDGIIIKR